MNILAPFDGMACGMLAMIKAGIKVDRYVAFEIDKYAVKTSSHNFPMIEHQGDVFEADFTQYQGFDFLVGGSPCTYWSIAQTKNRETVASGMGWELFSQYVRALHEAQPRFFIYENNKSMSKAIRESITETFGFEPICINSALVSAQNRQRLYWVGRRNPDGTYSKVHVEQPEDRGILLKDVLDEAIAWQEKAFCITATEYKGSNPQQTLTKHRRTMVAEPVNTTDDGKAWTIKSQYYKNNITNILNDNTQGCRFTATGVAEPVRAGTWPNNAKNQDYDSQQYRIYGTEGQSVTLCGNGGGMGAKTGLYAIPCCQMKVKEATKKGFAEINPGECVDLTQPNSKTRRGRSMADKSNFLVTSCQYWQYCGVLDYATPCEWDESGNVTKARSGSDGKVYTVYEVKDGQITIKGKQYPIKLIDGCYIIRKLTVNECKRLQTVPEWYEFPVSDSQAYKMLGNGWTVDVIAHLITATQEEVTVNEHP